MSWQVINEDWFMNMYKVDECICIFEWIVHEPDKTQGTYT